MKKFMFKFSLFISLITLIYCVLSKISVQVSFFRALIVFLGSYAILIAFFIGLRIVLVQSQKAGVDDEQ